MEILSFCTVWWNLYYNKVRIFNNVKIGAYGLILVTFVEHLCRINYNLDFLNELLRMIFYTVHRYIYPGYLNVTFFLRYLKIWSFKICLLVWFTQWYFRVRGDKLIHLKFSNFLNHIDSTVCVRYISCHHHSRRYGCAIRCLFCKLK